MISRARFVEFMPRAVEIITRTRSEPNRFRFLNGIVDNDVFPAISHMKNALEYNLPGGKHARGLMASNVCVQLQGDKAEVQNSALILGWAVEALQTCFLVADDIMDQSITRRGSPCWYRNKNVGLAAINDTLAIEASVYTLLRALPENYPISSLVELFQEITFLTVKGQTLDMQNSCLSTVDLDRFTHQNYTAIVKYKTSAYSFYLPIAAGLLASGHDPSDQHLKNILMEMGNYFQAQDDYLDCFGDPNVTGKVGTDIQDNKCSWLVVQALMNCSSDQKSVLQLHYGKNREDDILKIKELYDDLRLKEKFSEFEEKSYSKINKLINSYSGPLHKNTFNAITEKLYRRQN